DARADALGDPEAHRVHPRFLGRELPHVRAECHLVGLEGATLDHSAAGAEVLAGRVPLLPAPRGRRLDLDVVVARERRVRRRRPLPHVADDVLEAEGARPRRYGFDGLWLVPALELTRVR